MSKYMDDDGTLTLEEEGQRHTHIQKQMEGWIRGMLERGATIPEAAWSMDCLLKTALDNVRVQRWDASIRLRVWTDGTDLIVAETIAQAKQVQSDLYGDLFEHEDPSAWRCLFGNQSIRIWPDPSGAGIPTIATADEWIQRNGPHPALLAMGERGGMLGWEEMNPRQDADDVSAKSTPNDE
jgi:hypothetical protein